MENKKNVVVFWLRRDLRLEDNIGLYYALESGYEVLPVFIFDPTILSQFTDPYDRRVDYIHQALAVLNTQLAEYSSSIYVLHATPKEAFTQLLKEYNVNGVYCNEDYEPAAIKRDMEVSTSLEAQGIKFHSFTDQVLFAKNDIMKKDGTPYKMYSPYAKVWRKKLYDVTFNKYDIPYQNLKYCKHSSTLMDLQTLGYLKTDLQYEAPDLEACANENYGEVRDYPALDATSKLGMALRFGTVSIRQCIAYAIDNNNDVWLSQLIWREFFMQIMYHYPHAITSCFKPQYEHVQWRNNEKEFALWCNGQTGYPIVDAGMRELNATGYMHNRVRMIVASFLTKHLLIDWRWGEAYFAHKLNDFELASNNGNWQWAAGTGCDAAPYFRVFNPSEQQRKFDTKAEYIRKWVPEYETDKDYLPMVEHSMARMRAIEAYEKALKRD